MTITDAAPDGTSAGEPSAVALRVRGVNVSFGGIRALNDVSLTAARGQVLGLIGPNGAGKTTLFDVISGLRAPQEGTIEMGGVDVTSHSAVQRARSGMRRTFQRQQIFGRMSVEDNLLCASEWHGGGGGVLADLFALPARRRRERERRQSIEQVLELCGLTEHRGTPAGSLPIGLARMVELGRSLVDRPSVLLLDEPTSGLDEAELASVKTAIGQVLSAGDCAVLLVEHDISFVMEQCARIVVLELGTVIAEGTPTEIQANERVRDAYLG